jgi:pimeloyl-ACP methyl ester carboxylesterase
MLMMEGKSPPKDSLSWQRRYEAAVAHKSLFEAVVSNLWFNVTPVQTPRSPPSMALQNLVVPLVVIHGVNDLTVPHKQARAITELATACNWASASPGLISYYEHSGGHYPLFESAAEFCALYRKALEEQVLGKHS